MEKFAWLLIFGAGAAQSLNSAMRLFVRDPSCFSHLFHADNLDDLKSKVFTKLGIPESNQCLYYCGRELKHEDPVCDWLQDYASLDLNVELLGGGKKRKKKAYTTPKKIKHKRRKIKMATLKFYKVESNGKVVRLRKECPNKSCGSGVFMASHFDRMYCGKCSLTFMINK
ncbi:unnamed protein product [Protopolystoma xenopodis]|uniref:Ubiquitin-like domain-containing protein n=1 Tax=Protopolystoma xenopodis TaxID=117903 RepID=A0A3S5C694_9PLAT|nr:unnamed protein product [Protopolystoma xenopodis]